MKKIIILCVVNIEENKTFLAENERGFEIIFSILL